MGAVSSGPFETIESAEELMALLYETISDTRRDIERDLIAAASDHQQRREQALQLTLFKMDQLASAVHKTQRLLNDLRTLRRLIFNERNAQEVPTGIDSLTAPATTWEGRAA